MKKIYTLLLIVSLAFAGLSANAQIVKQKSHTVKKSTTHEYKIGDGVDVDAATGNKFVWKITKQDGSAALGTDSKACFEVYADRAGTTAVDIATVFNKKTIYVRWLNNADETVTYKVENTEMANGTDCSDDAINTKEVLVSLEANDFMISATKWDASTSATKTNENCAIAKDNAVGFVVARNGGDPRPWAFDYEYKLTNNGVIVTDWKKGDESAISWTDGLANHTDFDVDGDLKEVVGQIIISALTFPDFKDADLRGNGSYKVEIRIVKAEDFFKAPANNILDASNPPAVCLAEVTINKIPESQDINVD